MTTPTYIYKIVPSSTPPPSPLPEALPVSDLDQNDGFIHLSTEKQLPRTLNRFFQNATRVYILRIDYNSVEKDIKWENGQGTAPGGVGQENMFPHLYNGLRVGKAEIESFKEWEKDPQSSWDTAVDKARAGGWFIY